jgi:hypothetical protein
MFALGSKADYLHLPARYNELLKLPSLLADFGGLHPTALANLM